jgi:SAM-dependent methyltransferase
VAVARRDDDAAHDARALTAAPGTLDARALTPASLGDRDASGNQRTPIVRGGGELPRWAMGIWSDQVVPRMTDLVLGTPAVRRLREEVLAGLHGDVVEVGFGSGPNAALYPPGVRRVRALEPSAVATRRAAERIAAAPVPIELVGLDAQRLPLESASMDTAISTFTLCTIPDVERALGELVRVLKPGGTFCFLEHGRSPVDAVARWQRRLDPFQQRLAAGCHLDRPIDRLIEGAGLRIATMRHDELPGPRVLRPLGYLYLGTATKPVA